MRLRNLTAAAAVAVLVAACGGNGDETEPEAAPETESGTTADPAEDDAVTEPELPDPDDFITDGEFRGQGVVLPIPEGWSVDEFSLLQGLVVAVDDEDPSQQLAAQAIDASALAAEEEIDFDELLELQRNQFGDLAEEAEPVVDEEVELSGADRAHRLRFDEVTIEEQPAFSLDLILADDGDGTVALFNYAAPSEAFDEDIVELMLAGAGIDPDSDPLGPEPLPQQGPEGTEDGLTDEPQPVEPDEGAGDGAEAPDAAEQNGDEPTEDTDTEG
ncbi:hypothetical protein [Egicoccus halophilus]|uniref:DUF1795 domain-containing protein n=1 Tax=Egicoccus halophilus TaxID=1670830 RepID=A0A8J3AAT7_9ACTN|nr:hypothetical protein [Egicoccus halophilus]GGI06781.1 hypothetical protein GCM10011354_20810 [Egicoccus halophilus]